MASLLGRRKNAAHGGSRSKATRDCPQRSSAQGLVKKPEAKPEWRNKRGTETARLRPSYPGHPLTEYLHDHGQAQASTDERRIRPRTELRASAPPFAVEEQNAGENGSRQARNQNQPSQYIVRLQDQRVFLLRHPEG